MTSYTNKLRKQLLAGGYYPLPGIDKACRLKGWNGPFLEQEAEKYGSLAAAVDTWDERYPRRLTTNVQIRDRLIAVDMDVDDPGLAAAFAGLLRQIAPEVFERAPARFGSGEYKAAWFCRLADGEELFVRHGSRKYARPEDLTDQTKKPAYHHVEVFGGKLLPNGHVSRQFGAFGPHTPAKDGKPEISYVWADGGTLADVALADLPVITADQIWEILEQFEWAADADGWEAVSEAADGEGQVLFDIDRDSTRFELSDHSWVSYADLETMVEGGEEPRLWATFIPGEGQLTERGDRCQGLWSDKYHCAMVYDYKFNNTHLPADLNGLGLEGLGPILEKMKDGQEKAKAAAAVKATGIRATPYQWIDPEKIPQRDWLYGKLLIRKFVSMTVAPGGVGKSSLIAVEALSQVSNLPLLGEQERMGRKLRVWIWNLEDPQEETQRKIQAAAQYYQLRPSDIGNRLFVDCGRDQPLVIASEDKDGVFIVRPVIDALVEQIREKQIDILVIDPFVSCHEAPENDNKAQDMVVKEWGRVAELGDCAVHLVDHTKKTWGAEITTESNRGAKSKTDAARVVRVVNRMTEKEGKKVGIENYRLYFRLYNDKSNMAPPLDRSDWFKLESVSLGNGTPVEPSIGSSSTAGDFVGVVKMWQWPNPMAHIAGVDFVAVATAIRAGQWRENSQAKDWVGIPIAEALDLDLSEEADRTQVKGAIVTWLKEKKLVLVTRKDAQRKDRMYVEVGSGS